MGASFSRVRRRAGAYAVLIAFLSAGACTSDSQQTGTSSMNSIADAKVPGRPDTIRGGARVDMPEPKFPAPKREQLEPPNAIGHRFAIPGSYDLASGGRVIGRQSVEPPERDETGWVQRIRINDSNGSGYERVHRWVAGSLQVLSEAGCEQALPELFLRWPITVGDSWTTPRRCKPEIVVSVRVVRTESLHIENRLVPCFVVHYTYRAGRFTDQVTRWFSDEYKLVLRAASSLGEQETVATLADPAAVSVVELDPR